jgi:hypothetical protein
MVHNYEIYDSHSNADESLSSGMWHIVDKYIDTGAVEPSGKFVKLCPVKVGQEDWFSSWAVLQLNAVLCSETLIPLYRFTQPLIREI